MSEQHEATIAKYFTADTATPTAQETHVSPSGKYRLNVSWYDTNSGAWDVTLGAVSREGSEQPITKVYRNYSSFPFLFVEGHPNGHDYLVCGEDYQGQTVVELDTGKRRDDLPPEAEHGHGFCWTGMSFAGDASIVVVDGCVWACPYERRFYDFSNPMAGWPEIESDEYIDDDPAPAIVTADGSITVYQTERDEDGEPLLGTIVASRTFKRDVNKLRRVSEWVTEEEQKRRADREAARKAYDACLKEFRASDALYLAYIGLISDGMLSPEPYESIGITYAGWCPTFNKTEQRLCRRIIKDAGPRKTTADLEWAWESGPVKIQLYQDGKTGAVRFFEHSVAGMEQAFAYAIECSQ